MRACRELGRRRGAAIGLSELHESAADSARAYRQALDATMIGRALLGDGGAIGYAEVGAYRYLVHIGAENAPHDRMRAAVDRLIEYDARRRTSLLDTLERYLAERRSVIESARELFIHPNTLRQRLGRIEELTGLHLDEDDLLSLELAIKLARLHGRRRPGTAAATRRLDAGGAPALEHQEHRDLRLAADPLRFLGPQKSPTHAVAVRIGAHHDRVAARELGLVDDPLGRLARSDHVPVSLDALALEALDRLVHDVALLLPLRLGREQPGHLHPERDAVYPGDREHADAGVRGLRQLDDPRDHGVGERPTLGREQDPLERPLVPGSATGSPSPA